MDGCEGSFAMVVDKANRKKMSRVAATAALAGALAIGAGGCAAAKPAGSSSGSAPVHKEQVKKTPAQLAAVAYREVLEDPQGYFGRNDGLEEQFVADAEYTYALVNMSTDELPQLLVCASGSNDAWNGMESVQVFSFDAKSGSLVTPTEDLAAGVAGAGGFRGSLSYSAAGNGLLYSTLSSGTGMGSIVRITLDGDQLSQTFAAPVDLSSGSKLSSVVSSEGREITWTDVADDSALKDLESGSWKSTVEKGSGAADAARAAGLATFTGTVRILDDAGVCDLQGVANPNPDYPSGHSYVVLDLGGEQQVTCLSGDGSSLRDGNTSLLLLDTTDSGNSWSALDGKTVTVAVDTPQCSWPSDTGLPLGSPRCAGHVAVIG